MFRLYLLKSWKDPSGKEWAKGQTIELDDKTVAGELVMDGTAKKADPEPKAKEDGADETKIAELVGTAVKDAIDAKSDDLEKTLSRKLVTVEVHDKADDDPFHGFLPGEIHGRDPSADEKHAALGLFCRDVFAAGPNLSNMSERLTKSVERSDVMVQKAIKDGLIDKAAGDGMTAGSDTSLGALIPPELNTMLLDRGLESAVIRPRATVIPISSDKIDLPRVKNYDHSSSTVFGGMQAYWKGEDAQLTETKPTLEEISLTPQALTILAYVSHRALKFSPITMGAYLLPKMADTITWKEEDAFVNGTGAGMPLGLVNAPCRRSVSAETGQTASANVIVTANVDNMVSRLHIERGGSVVFIYNRPELYTWLKDLKREVGTGGAIERYFQRTGTGTERTLDGYPCLDTEHAAAAATEGDLILTDLSQYLIADDRSGAEVAQSMHLKFDYGQTAFRIMKYTDGSPANSTYFTRQKGSNTLASIMTIATRT